jgi:hypothetical protein
MKIPDWVKGFGKFLLNALGWIVIAIFINFIASYFIKLPSNRVDLFSLIEVLFGVVITALAIVASFSVSSQWREFERSVQVHSDNMKRTIQEAGISYEALKQNLKEIQDFRSSIEHYRETLGTQDNIIEEIKKIEEIRSKEIKNLLEAVEEAFKNIQKSIPSMVEEQIRSIGLIATIDKNKQVPEVSSQQPENSGHDKDKQV